MAGHNKPRRQSPLKLGAHKLFAPPKYVGAIARETILRKIFEEQAQAQVILVQGPAGHGKTTVMAQVKALSESMQVRTGWLTFEEADNDPHRFFVHLQAVVTAIEHERDGRGAFEDNGLAEQGRRHRKDWLINHLVDVGAPVSLFLDEFQLITNKSIHVFMRQLLEHLPDGVRIFIGSRTIPELGLTRLVVNNQALVFRANDLCFSAEEVSRFFAETGELNIRDDEVAAIYRQTEGWPAALQLFRLTLVNPAVRQSLEKLGSFRLPELADYLVDNVLALQSREIQAFLIRTSLLTRLSAALCDAVMGSAGSQEILMFLERAGLFVRSLGPEQQWFKYHTLFSSFLQEQMRQTWPKAEIIAVHRLAADWYHEQELFEEAMHHYIAANEYGRATQILEIWSSRLIADAHLATVERWYDRLPLEEIEKRPDLLVKIAWALTFLRRHVKLATILESLEHQEMLGHKPAQTNPQVVRAMAALLADNLAVSYEIIRQVEVYRNNPAGFGAFELGAAANLSGYFALTAGDFDAAREVLRIARAYSDCADAAFSWGYSVSNSGVTALIQGRLRDALDRFRLAIADARVFRDESFAAASLVSCYIQALYEANELDAAEALFDEFKHVIKEAALLDYLAVAYVTMARIHDARGRSSAASALLDEAESIGFAHALPRLLRLVNWERVRRMLLQGEVEQAGFSARRIRTADDEFLLPESWIPFSEDTEGEAIGRIRLAIHSAHADEAMDLLAAEQHAPQTKGRVRRQIKLHLLEALARQQQGNDNAAHRCLGLALHLAEEGGFIRTFLEEGKALIDMLHEQASSPPTTQVAPGREDVQSGHSELILKVIGSELGQNALTKRFEPLEQLTQRETEILIYLARGVSNKEMARRIYLSENTVKFHLKNIYSKLAVGSRLQAINAARQMGLIENYPFV